MRNPESAPQPTTRTRRNAASVAIGAALALLAGGVFAQDGDAIAMVNGDPVSRRQMVDALLEAHGVQMLQQYIVLTLAKAETKRLNLRVARDDVDKEFQRAFEKIAPPTDEKGKPFTDEERQQALDMLLQRKGLTRVEFTLGMERNAHLRKVVEQNVRFDEALLREEYARLYGEKVQVRHIQLGDMTALDAALKRLGRGDDFAEVARTLSENESAAHGGLLEPFTFNDDQIAPELRQIAFDLKQPGEVSKWIRVGRWFQILKLERRIPSDEASFDSVRDKVEQSLRERVTRKKMNEMITEMFKKANVKILDERLRQNYAKALSQSALVEPTGP